MQKLNYEIPVMRARASTAVSRELARERPRYRFEPGFLMLFYGDGQPIRVVNHCLATEATRNILAHRDWRRSQEAFADDAAQATTFFHSQGKTWDDLNYDLIADFAESLLSGYSVWTRKKLSNATVKRRIGTVLKIGRFACTNHYTIRDGNFQTAKPSDIAEAVATNIQERGGRVDDLTSRLTVLPKVNPILQVKLILEQLGGDILNLEVPSSQCRDRLIAEASLYTGLRVDEVANLTVRQILYLASEKAAKPHLRQIPLWINHTKGTKPGFVVFPTALISALLKYVETERAAVVDDARRTNGGTYRDPGMLFLNSSNSNHRDIGVPVTPSNISRTFRRAVTACGFMGLEEQFVLNSDFSIKRDPSGELLTHFVRRPAHTFHDLRHTFAVVQYYVRVRRGDKNPLGTVRTLLRHALSKTTADLYLNWFTVYEHELSGLLDEYFYELDAAEGLTS